MKIDRKIHDEHILLDLKGVLDEKSAHILEIGLNEALNDPVRDDVYLDMSRLSYLTSAGMRILISSYKQSVKVQKNLKIISMSPEIEKTLRMVRIKDLFTGEKTFK